MGEGLDLGALGFRCAGVHLDLRARWLWTEAARALNKRSRNLWADRSPVRGLQGVLSAPGFPDQ